MRAVVQRVVSASVSVAGTVTGAIARGVLVYVGITHEDSISDIEYVANKVTGLRIYPDENGVMNRSVLEVAGDEEGTKGTGILVVSQFTLYGDARKGRRPSYNAAAPPETARPLYEAFLAELCRSGLPVETGAFQEIMQVSYINEGPVTILIDSKKLF